jgi:hypothetical protein
MTINETRIRTVQKVVARISLGVIERNKQTSKTIIYILAPVQMDTSRIGVHMRKVLCKMSV